MKKVKMKGRLLIKEGNEYRRIKEQKYKKGETEWNQENKSGNDMERENEREREKANSLKGMRKQHWWKRESQRDGKERVKEIWNGKLRMIEVENTRDNKNSLTE